MKEKKKLFVIGLDGATFDIITPLINEGRLENIASLMEQGAWGELRSTIPAFSPIAWTSLITGVNPGKHGITDGFIHHLTEYRISFVNSTYRKYKPIWSVLNTFGKKTGMVNIPLTYPPEHVNGFMITGMFTPENVEDFIYPPELKDTILKKVGKYVFEGIQSRRPEKILRTTYDTIDQHDDIALFLLNDYDLDFFFLVYVESDRIQHQFWKFMDEKNTTVFQKERNRYKNAVKDLYQRLDLSIGKILKRMRDDDTLMIVSDHGFGPLHKVFSLSNWLIENEYTVYKDGVHLNNTTKPNLLGNLYKKLLSKFADKDKELNRFFGHVDWRRTKAFTEGAAEGIFINLENRQKEGIVKKREDYEKLRDEIIDKLKDLRDPLNGRRVIEKIHRVEDIYHGGDLNGTPDLVVECSPKYHSISPSECVYHKFDDKEMFFNHKWSGKHEEEGIFILKGPTVKKGQKLKNANIMDVAPTMLYLMGIPVSNEFDGKVLLNAIKHDYLASNPVEYADYSLKTESEKRKSFSEEESMLLDQRLTDLGYIE